MNKPILFFDMDNVLVDFKSGIERLIFLHHKNLCHGDYLIDDRPKRNGVDQFCGEVLHFDTKDPAARVHTWDEVVTYLMAK